jgi:hypothetical protein
MIFSGLPNSNIIIPDLYAMKNYSNNLLIKDNLNNKLNQGLFIGGSSGSTNPIENERLNFCSKYRYNNNIKSYISHFCQIPENNIKSIFPNYRDFKHDYIKINDQYIYKYLISIDGNTSAWDRVPWILNSKSVLLKKNSNHKCWYYDLLIPNVHYIPFDENTDLDQIILSNENRQNIINNANKFVKDYLTEDKHILYMGHLLYHCSLKYKSQI